MLSRIMFIALIASSLPGFSQLAITPRPSPLAIVNARYKDSYLKITYAQPHKRERIIFGGLVPYGEVWRLGADESTEMTVTKDILVNGTLLKAGTYSMFAIPDKDHWTMIINADVGQWGAHTYNVKLDVMRFNMPVVTLTDVVYEPFTIFIDQKNEKADIIFYWDKIKASFPIQFTEPK